MSFVGAKAHSAVLEQFRKLKTGGGNLVPCTPQPSALTTEPARLQ